MTGRGSDAGFVLVNALVLVAAMAAAAVFLLARAEGSHARLIAGQHEQVLRHGLDALETMSREILNRDLSAGPIDSPDEAWHSAIQDVALSRGRVSGQISDQQSLFNINWLADPENSVAREGFDILLARLGLSQSIGEAVTEFVSARGPANRQSFSALKPSVAPQGGPIFLPNQLFLIPEIAPRDLARLEPYITVLPTNSKLNVNTVLAPVLMAMLPQIPASRIPVLTQRRMSEPYANVEEFLNDAGLSSDIQSESDVVDLNRFSIGSNWFEVEITANDGPRLAQRRTLLRRESLQQGTQVEWRVSKY